MSNIESAILVLRTSDLTLGGANVRGIKDSYNVSPFTWKNINLRTLLGTMYDKYDLFNLNLLQVSNGGMALTGNQYHLSADPNNNTVVMQISGLPFINNTYNTTTQHNTNTTTLTNYAFGNLTTISGSTITTVLQPGLMQLQTCQGNTFGKSLLAADITIIYKRIIDNEMITVDGTTTTGLFPEVMFMFSITGIPKDEGNLNSTRMKI
jgi:hypothetical protein